jgi:hypothetical protein
MVEDLKKGSEKLRQALPFGAIRKIADVFGISEAWVGQVLKGNKKGNQKMVECASRISSLHVEQLKKIEVVLKQYE